MMSFNKRRSPMHKSIGSDEEDNDEESKIVSRTEHEKQIGAIMTVNPKAVDDILSREMQQLSFMTRSEINEEVHGVRCLSPEESEELRDNSIERLLQELKSLEAQGKAKAYAQASSIPHSYIHTIKFQLKFLRAELYEPKKAAVRMAQFLDIMLEFFGPFALERSLQFADLKKQDIEVLRGGDVQPLPFRDRSGRRVVVTVNQFTMQYPFHARYRANLYLHTVLSEDEESQQKGFVAVMCWPSKNSFQKTSIYGQGSKEVQTSKDFFAGLPWRLIAMHICFPDKPIFHMLRSGMALTMGEGRSRLRFHCGESLELQYYLNGYGIPADQLPVTDSGNVKTKNLLSWIKVRKALEGAAGPSPDNEESTIECPGSNDVIFRCGQAYLCHPGNVMFRGLIEGKFDEHNLSPTSEGKTAITWGIIKRVEKTQGRFLIWNDGWWLQMTDKQQVRSKVANAFKDHKRRLKAISNCQVSQSSTFKFERQDLKKRKRPDQALSSDAKTSGDAGMFCMT